ncbi:MAG: molybdopterin-dependent oxidoreductase [Myxococcota bacterium]
MRAGSAANTGDWHSTACILCSINCALQVQVEDRHIVKIRGDRSNPRSLGYTCEKQAGLDHYQNHRDRLTSPLRRRADGSFEEIDWDTAIREVAARLAEIRDTLGGEKILYYGGGGQGNHLGGAYSSATVRAYGGVYRSNALAQEKTGEFWVERRMFSGRPEPDFANAEVAVFVGKNPWHSHGFERARIVLREIARDPARSMIVIDPRRTETAELADVHLQVRPGSDAHCLSALLAVLIEEDLLDQKFLSERTTGAADVIEALSAVPIADYCERAGVPESRVREAARRVGRAESVAVVEDLGVEMAPHSTLNSYLEKLLYALTGNFAKPGTMNLGTHMGRLAGTTRGDPRTPVGGHRIIAGLMPCNVIPDEILTDHPDRLRAAFIESGNPAHSLADSQRMRQALEALDLVVVIDVAMTETARLADYVLPAASQYEKWETTFFGGGFPDHVFQLRPPLMEPLAGTLPEPEIHARLVYALGGLCDEDLVELRAAAAEGRRAFQTAFARAMVERPELRKFQPVVLYRTLGPTLGTANEGAALIWGAAHSCAAVYPESVRRAGYEGEGPELGERLFDAIFTTPEGVVITRDRHEVSLERITHEDGRIQLAIPELIQELSELPEEDPSRRDDAFPFILAAGERRTSTANTIFRDPGWRRKDREGALRMSVEDAAQLGIAPGGRARVTTKRASVDVVVEITDTLRPGHVTLPNGQGLEYPDEHGQRAIHGAAPNELTASEDRDWLAGTPWHKHVRARVEALL